MSEARWPSVLSRHYRVPPVLLDLATRVVAELTTAFQSYDELALDNQARVMEAFAQTRIHSHHLSGTTGYGYGDEGREKAARVFARIFGAQEALVSPHLLSGTHSLSACLYGVLRPGDAIVSLTGAPYDTLASVLGLRPAPGSLREFGISYDQCLATALDDTELARRLLPPVKLGYIQRSGGYTGRAALSMATIAGLIERVRRLAPEVIILVDNCYGEFVERMEPGQVGAQLVAGSLIKNPGGGLSESGGYIAGDGPLIEQVAARLSVPGQGRDVGSYLPGYRSILQGVFMAPGVVSGALKGVTFAARFFEELGFIVRPTAREPRSDIIQQLQLGSPAALEAFCRGIQKASPVDAEAHPQPWNMPGYEHPIIMAAGTFVQGASLELTADGRFEHPYAVYMQGGLSFSHVFCATLVAATELVDQGLSLRPKGSAGTDQ